MAGVPELHSGEEIATCINRLAADIAAALPREFIVVGLLKGCFVFVADLVRALDAYHRSPPVEFMRLSSYGLGKISAGEVHLIGDIPTDIAGSPILLVDDIVDTGRSLTYAQALLRQRNAGRIWVCTLIDKPSRREVAVDVDFVGFTVGDVFIAGYGIDYAERYRGLPYIGVVDG